MEEKKSSDPDEDLLKFLTDVLYNDSIPTAHRVSAGSLLLAHGAKWNSGRGMASGIAAAEEAAEIRKILRAFALGKGVLLHEEGEDRLFEARLHAARLVLL
jgi:hypothetical protein